MIERSPEAQRLRVNAIAADSRRARQVWMQAPDEVPCSMRISEEKTE